MFSKILIANRGEIACRIIRTARRLGIKTVAVYSDADVKALHVETADEAVHIGPAPVAQSYLQADKIIEAAKATGAQAIHPGYGFLSENPDFVKAVETAGLVFIGPSALAIQAMGLKDAAKALMEKAGVPVVPGYHGEEQDADFLAHQAAQIGYPVLIKARAGGGGKGMRRVDKPEDFADALASAAREGKASFGDGHCLIEKYIAKPRHIEIQIFGDQHGGAVYLFERDCSLQRRHQKVIEEAPAPGMPEAMRQAMGAAAVKAAKAIGYAGAGTVEFIVDGSDGLSPDKFYFMEMNTRLQVEHPVTEAITGLDLVEWQLRTATGEPLPKAQEDLTITGWAFEARIYAEDAARGFLPATGTINMVDFPAGLSRVDTGVRSGDEISPFYDPMIAKVITHGPTRETALAQLRQALAHTLIAGTTANVAFLHRLAGNEDFIKGDVDTGLIERHLTALITPAEPGHHTIAAAALKALGLLDRNAISRLNGWRLWGAAHLHQTLSHRDDIIDIGLTQHTPKRFSVTMADQTIELTILAVEDAQVRLQVGTDIVSLFALSWPGHVGIFENGENFIFGVPDPLATSDDTGAAGDRLIAPMPGLVKLLQAKPGHKVAKGDKLIVLEAMKMEHTLTAPRDGEIAEVYVEEGMQVSEGTALLELVTAPG